MEKKGKIWKKCIQNPIDTPWFDWIKCEMKKFEGRIFRDDWQKMNIGDIIIFDSGNEKLETIITEFKYYNSFVEAFNDLGSLLVPIESCTNKNVEDFYSKIYHKEVDKSDIQKNGVIAVGIKPFK